MHEGGGVGLALAGDVGRGAVNGLEDGVMFAQIRSGHDTVLRVGDLEMDLIKRVVTRSGRRIELQAQEFKLLEYLMRNTGRIVTRTMLLENVWEFTSDPKTTVIETHISRLRRKVDRGFGEELLETVRGAGYRLRTPSSPAPAE